jgi:carboxypeptidase family protein
MRRAFFLGLCLVAIVMQARADQPGPIKIVVLTPDGKPAAGAKAWLVRYSERGKESKQPEPLIVDDSGCVSVSIFEKEQYSALLFIRDGDGRIGCVGFGQLQWEGERESQLKVVLADANDRAGRLVGPDGKPVPGAIITPLGYGAENGIRQGLSGGGSYLRLPEWERIRLTVKTDADGRFKLSAPIAGYSVHYRVRTDAFGESDWSSPNGGEIETKLFEPGSLTINVEGVDPALLKDLPWQLNDVDKAANEGLRTFAGRWRSGEFDATGKVTIKNVVPGRYEFTMRLPGNIPTTFEKTEIFEVPPGKAIEVLAKFQPAATVTGAVIDKATEKGVAGVDVFVNLSDGNEAGDYGRYLKAKTDKDGRYAVHGPTGWYSPRISAEHLPDGFAPTVENGRGRPMFEPVKVEAGKSHAFPAIALLKSIILTGKVVFPDGKPAAGAMYSDEWNEREKKFVADNDGNFTLKNLPPDDAVSLHVRLGKAVNVPQTIALSKQTKGILIEVSEANAAAFAGQVVDSSGKPVAGLVVVLRHAVRGVGRHAALSTSIPSMKTITDAEGRYAFSGLWPRDEYSVQASGEGFARVESKELRGTAGETQEFPPIKIARASLAVRGIVVGMDGKPIAGAEVFGVDGVVRFATTSAADGTFTLTGFFDGPGYAFARKTGFRLAAIPVLAGSPERISIAIAPTISPPAPAPVVSAAHRAALDKLTRRVLTVIWQTHSEFGYGGNAIEDMARIDLDLAKQWRDDIKKRTNGKTDFTPLVNRAVCAKTLVQVARDDIDEALAMVQQLRARDGFIAAIRAGNAMLPIDKSKSIRFAEEAVVKARQCDSSERVWSLAEAGDLAIRAGNAVSGKKLLFEAADLAAKLDQRDGPSNRYAISEAAAYLAPQDLIKADALLATIKDSYEYNRSLSIAAGRIAPTDLTKAKQLLARFKRDNTFVVQEAQLRVAFAIAAQQPDEAIAAIDGVGEYAYRFQGYLGLAKMFAPTDKARMVKMIDTAFGLLENEPDRFSSWTDFGGDCAFAALGAARASEIGYPDAAGLVTRVLAMRPTGREAYSAQYRDDTLVKIAALLALVDPPTARRVLATVAPPKEFAERASAVRGWSQRREWLYAQALADPEQAGGFVDKLIDQAKAKRGKENALSETGLVELASILVADNRLKALTDGLSLALGIDVDD